MTDPATDTDQAAPERGDTTPEPQQEDVMTPRARTASTDTDQAPPSVVRPLSPGLASELAVEQVAPLHYMKHRRTGEVTSVGDHGAYLELNYAGWAITDEVPEGGAPARGGVAI